MLLCNTDTHWYSVQYMHSLVWRSERRELQLVKQKYEREMTQLRERVRAPVEARAGVVQQQQQQQQQEAHSMALEAAAAGVSPSQASGSGAGGARAEATGGARNASRSGYLFVRQKPSLLGAARWERAFLFTQAGSLMCLGKEQVLPIALPLPLCCTLHNCTRTNTT